MRFEVIQMTPKLAATFLAMNVSNRKVRSSRVDEWAGAMRRGEWKLSPQGISITKSRQMTNGQHRLLAVIKSGVSVPMVVAYDVAEDVPEDIGLSKSNSDLTGIAKAHTEVLTFFATFSSGEIARVSSAQIRELASVFLDESMRLKAHAPSIKRGFTTAPIRAAAIVLAMEGQRDRAFDLYRRLTLTDFENLPKSTASFFKQVVTDKLCAGANSGVARQAQSFCKALVALDAKTANRVVYAYNQEMHEAAKSRVLKLILTKDSK